MIYLGHVLENFFSAPPIDVPVIVVLWSAANAQGTIDATGAAEKSVRDQNGTLFPMLGSIAI